MVAIVSSLAKKIESSIVNINRACFDKRSRENKYSCSTSATISRICTKVQSIYYKHRLKKKLL